MNLTVLLPMRAILFFIIFTTTTFFTHISFSAEVPQIQLYGKRKAIKILNYNAQVKHMPVKINNLTNTTKPQQAIDRMR